MRILWIFHENLMKIRQKSGIFLRVEYNECLSIVGELKMSEELDDLTFDLDNLYDGVAGNSENPIDASEPEEIEDVGCVGGACTL